MDFFQVIIMYKPLYAIVLASAMNLGTAYAEPLKVAALENQVKVQRTLSLSGSAQIEASPDEAIIRVSVITENQYVNYAQQKNADIADAVMKALKGSGENNIETLNYTIEEASKYENNTYVKTGYRVSNTVKITTQRLDHVGSIIDVAVNAGANSLSGISFALSSARKEKIKYHLLTNAMDDAKTKARLLADSVGAKVGKVLAINESGYYRPKEVAYDFAAPNMMKATPTTPINPKNVDTSATVSVIFELDYK